MTTPPNDDVLQSIATYRKIVHTYEQLNDEIHKLIEDNGGGTENMTTEQIEHYRTLARKRDEAQNDLRLLERQLLDENQ